MPKDSWGIRTRPAVNSPSAIITAGWKRPGSGVVIPLNANGDVLLQRDLEAFARGLQHIQRVDTDLVENHGQLSSNGEWLSSVMKMIDHPRAGTLPDFGNFRISENEEYDRYKGVAELMPFARGVSAKSHEFDVEGNEVRTDYFKMLQIVKDAGFKGYIGIEYEGDQLGEFEGIMATKELLEKVRAELS